jgi:hypothetical protein
VGPLLRVLGQNAAQRRPKAGAYYTYGNQLANHFKDRVAAYELWVEPELQCKFPGQPWEFRDYALAPGFDGIKAAQPDAIVLGPTVHGGNTNLDNWYTHAGADGVRYLKRPVRAISVNEFGSVDEVRHKMNLAHDYRRCMQDGSYCVTDYWLSAFGFNDDQPASRAAEIMAKCDSHSDCKRAVYYAAEYNGYDAFGNVYGTFSLLNTKTLAPKSKYWKLKEYMLSTEPPLP